MLDMSTRFAFSQEHGMFRDSVRKLFDQALIPNLDKFERDGMVTREFWKACGDAGMLCPNVAEAWGGMALDYGYNAVVCEELSYAGSSAGITLQSDITAGYIEVYGSEEQKLRYLPGMVSGDIVSAIAMTEPGAGSDLQGIKTTARRDGGDYIINGSKTYITNGQLADVIIVVTKTNPELGGKGTSLILVDADTPGFARGRNLDKIGQHSADTSELFFEDVRVPVTNCLGAENQGFNYLMSLLPQERLTIAVSAQAAAQRAFDEAVAFTKERKAFGKTLLDFQNTRFKLAECATEAKVGRAFVDDCIAKHLQGKLDAATASMAKMWLSERCCEVADTCLQMHGGYGYMFEYPVARIWTDARVGRIYGGTNEIMRELIARSL